MHPTLQVKKKFRRGFCTVGRSHKKAFYYQIFRCIWNVTITKWFCARLRESTYRFTSSGALPQFGMSMVIAYIIAKRNTKKSFHQWIFAFTVFTHFARLFKLLTADELTVITSYCIYFGINFSSNSFFVVFESGRRELLR